MCVFCVYVCILSARIYYVCVYAICVSWCNNAMYERNDSVCIGRTWCVYWEEVVCALGGRGVCIKRTCILLHIGGRGVDKAPCEATTVCVCMLYMCVL